MNFSITGCKFDDKPNLSNVHVTNYYDLCVHSCYSPTFWQPYLLTSHADFTVPSPPKA